MGPSFKALGNFGFVYCPKPIWEKLVCDLPCPGCIECVWLRTLRARVCGVPLKCPEPAGDASWMWCKDTTWLDAICQRHGLVLNLGGK